MVGTISLLVEEKANRFLGRVGHLEDLVVHADFRGIGIAHALIQHVQERARRLNCYKLVLECREDLKSFYEGEGFQMVGICMRLDNH